MPKLDPTRYNPDPAYLHELIDAAGITSRLAARIMRIDARMFRHMLAGRHDIPYSVQFCLEYMAENPPQKGDIDWDSFHNR